MNMGYVKDESPQTIGVDGTWILSAYHYKGSLLTEEYVKGLKQKRLIGSFCPGCAKVIVPPRNLCGRCHRIMDGRKVVSNWGTITCFVVSQPIFKGKLKVLGMDPVEVGLIKDGEIVIPVFVRFDGADSNTDTILLNADPKDVHIGMRVKVVWAKKPQGMLSDFEGVEPI
jgi:uncharacterized OB-fold protein